MMTTSNQSSLLPLLLLWMILGSLAFFEFTCAFQPNLLHPQRKHPSTGLQQRNHLVGTERPSSSRDTTTTTTTTRRYDVSLAASSSTSSSSSTSRKRRNRRRRRQLSKDVVIVGGGLAGLSVALYLSQIDPDRQVTIVDKDEIDATTTNAVASFAAAGMLAPHSERLPKGSLLDLCLESRRMYPEFCDMVETLAEDSGEEGLQFLPNPSEDNNNLEPWNIGYVGAGGFLAPAFAGDNVATWAPPEDSKGNAKWLDSYQVRELEPNLDPKVVGGWWFPEDASVDARRLTCSLRAACVGMGVQYLSGPNYEVSSLDLSDGKCHGLWLKNGKYISAKSVLVANGSWMRTLLPVPLEPHKGQSLSLRMPKDRPPLLRRVLFAQDSYIVPKADGRIVIGATVEAGSFDPNVTPAGIMHILSYALELVPALKDLPLDETWAGLRPTTPDKGPILGETPWENLFLAGGYWRNGVLLAPKTGELLASLIAGEPLNDQDRRFLDEFAWDRFTAPGKGAALAANARFAASMYPVHTRKSGVGVAAAVGTELGSYSTARSAGEERARDRETLWGTADDDDDAFERAANLGKLDGTAFTYDDDDDEENESESVVSATTSPTTASESSTESSNNSTWAGLLESSPNGETQPYDGSPDALTVSYSEEDSSNNKKSDLQSMYASIQKNKAGQSVELDNDTTSDDRPDPGFRIYHVDKKTGKEREVPPYTSPGDFVASINNNDEDGLKEDEGESKESFDGYSTILSAAAKDSNIQETMRKARISNRIGDEGIELDIDFSGPKCTDTSNGSSPAVQTPDSNHVTDLSDVYQKIRDQKTASTPSIDDESDTEERPDPGFRIYHIDKETGEHREVPPYTSPGDFLMSFQKKDDFPPPPPTSRAENNTPSTVNGSTTQQRQDDDYSEKTFDGYQDIIEANASVSRDDELAAMREARRSNRIGQETVSDSDL